MRMNLSKLWISLSELGNSRWSRVSRKFRLILPCVNLIAARANALGASGLTVNVAFPELPENSCLASGRNTPVMFGPSKPIGNWWVQHDWSIRPQSHCPEY